MSICCFMETAQSLGNDTRVVARKVGTRAWSSQGERTNLSPIPRRSSVGHVVGCLF